MVTLCGVAAPIAVSARALLIGGKEMGTVIWIEKGEHSQWLAKAVVGAFQSAIILDCVEIGPECVTKVIPQLQPQPVGIVAICEAPIAMRSQFGGLAILPYGTRIKARTSGVFVHTPGDGRPQVEKDKTVDTILTFLKKNKVLLKL